MTIKNNKPYKSRKSVLSIDEFEPQNVKIRITTMIDEDVLLRLREIATQKGMKYQRLINMVLRTFTALGRKSAASKNLTEAHVRRIVRDELKKIA